VTQDPSIIRDLFSLHYFYLALFSTTGTLQIATSIGNHRGFWILPGRKITRVFGVMLLAIGITFFFLQPLWTEGPWATGQVGYESSTREWGKANWNELGAARNMNDVDGGLSGTDQATWFPLAAFLAGVISLIFGSINRRIFPSRIKLDPKVYSVNQAQGMELLGFKDYPAALKCSWKFLVLNFKSDAKKLFDESPKWSISVIIWRYLRR